MTEEKRPRRQSQRLGESRSRNTRLPKKTSPVKRQKLGDWFWVSLGVGIVMMVGVLIFLLLPGDETQAIPEVVAAPEQTVTEPVETIPDPAASGYSERAIADWILSNGGRVRVLESSRPVYEVYDKTALPSGDFKLQAVSLDGIEAVTDARVGELWGLQTLAELGLSGTKITDEGVKTLPKLKSLNTVNLRGCPITDQGLSTLGSMSNLKLLIADGGLPPMSTVREAGITITPPAGQTAVSFTDDGLESLSGLKSLQTLSLVSSKASDSGLAAIAKSATKLVQLRTVGFGITNGGVSALKPLTNLRVLELSNSLIDDGCIDTLSQLKWLECLVVQGTNITPAGVKRLQQKLPNCKVFGGKFDPRLNVIREIYVLGGTVSISIDGKPPQQVKAFADLPEKFVVSTINLTGVKKLSLTDVTLPEATELILKDSAVEPMELKLLANLMPALKRLNLSGTSVSDEQIPWIAHQFGMVLQALDSIDITRTKMTPDGSVRLRCYTTGCEVLDGVPDPAKDREVAEWAISVGGNVEIVPFGSRKQIHAGKLDNLPKERFQLKGIDVSGMSQVNDADFERLPPLRYLTSLGCVSCTVTDAGIFPIGKVLTLRWLSIHHLHPGFTDVGMASLREIKHLQVIHWGTHHAANQQLTATGLRLLPVQNELLQFYMQGSTAADDDYVAAVFERCPNIHWSFMLANAAITDVGVLHIATHCKALTVEIHSCKYVTDQSIRELCKMPNVHELSLSRMKITDAGLAPLMERGPLKRLSIRQTDVSDEFIAKLKEKFPKLDVQTESEDRRRWVEGIQKAGGKLKLITRQGKLIELAPGDPQPTTGFTVRSVDISNYKGFDRFSMLYWQDILGEMSEINLADSSFSGAGFKDFVKATKMATIIATNTNVVDAHLELFPKLPSLKRLDLRGTAVTAPAVQKVKQRLPNGCVVQFGDNEE